MSLIHSVSQTLSKSPEIGVLSSLVATVFPFIETVTPILQVMGLVVGLAIGILTAAIKYKEYKKLRNDESKKHS